MLLKIPPCFLCDNETCNVDRLQTFEFKTQTKKKVKTVITHNKLIRDKLNRI